jgi:hypothetical protein
VLDKDDRCLTREVKSKTDGARPAILGTREYQIRRPQSRLELVMGSGFTIKCRMLFVSGVDRLFGCCQYLLFDVGLLIFFAQLFPENFAKKVLWQFIIAISTSWGRLCFASR